MTAALISTRGDVDEFNLAAYLWAIRERQMNGRDFKAVLGPESFTYKWYTSKAQSELNGQDGGFLAPEEWADTFHDVIRDNSTFRSLPVQRPLTRARIHRMAVAMSDWAFTYGGDNSSATTSDVKYATRIMTMKKATGFRTFSNELLKDASDLADQFLRQSAGEAVSFEIDKQTLWGNGQGATPVGLLNMTNVPAVDVGGAAPTMVQLAQMVYNAKSLNQSSNVPAGSATDVAVVAHPRIENTVRNMTTPGNTAPWLFGLGQEPVQRFLGVQWVLTAAIPITFTSKLVPTGGTQTQLYAGDWKRLRVVMRSDFEFMISPEANAGGSTGFQSDQSLVRIVARYDVSATHPEAFNLITSAVQ